MFCVDMGFLLPFLRELADNNNNAPPFQINVERPRLVRDFRSLNLSCRLLSLISGKIVDFVHVRVRKFIGAPWFRARMVLMPHSPNCPLPPKFLFTTHSKLLCKLVNGLYSQQYYNNSTIFNSINLGHLTNFRVCKQTNHRSESE